MRRLSFALPMLLLALPAPAAATTVTADPGDDASDGGVSIEARGARNDLTVSARGQRGSIREHGHAPLVAGDGCVQHGPHRVACAPDSYYVLSLEVYLGSGADTLALYEADSSYTDIEVHGGTGRDSLTLMTSHGSQDYVFGGDGADVIRAGAGNDALE